MKGFATRLFQEPAPSEEDKAVVRIIILLYHLPKKRCVAYNPLWRGVPLVDFPQKRVTLRLGPA